MSGMSEISSQFSDQFGAALDLAKWNEGAAGYGQSAWFSSARTAEDTGYGQYETELVKMREARLLVGDEAFAPEIRVAEPAWMANDRRAGVRLFYERTLMSGGEQPVRSELSKNALPHMRDSRGEWRMPARSYTPARVGRVCVKWARLVDTFDDLGTVVTTYLDWMRRGGHEEAHESNSRIATRSMHRSLAIALETGQSYDAATPYIDALAGIDKANPNHRAVLEMSELALRGALLGQPLEKEDLPRMIKGVPQPLAAKSSQQEGGSVPVSLAMDAVRALDARDILTPRWWMGVGIVAGGAITVPDLLPMVHEKLTGDEGAAIAAETPAISSQALIRSYIGKLMNAYAGDGSDRDRLNLGKFKRLIMDASGTADLKRLVDIANWILEDEVAAAENRSAKRIPPERLDKTSMFSIGDALLTILYHTRPKDAPNEVWAAQFDQDVLHAEIIDTLHAELRIGRTETLARQMALDSLRLRYPFVDRQSLETIRGELTSGASPATIRGRYRGSQGATISKWRLHSPGRGLVS